MMMMNKEKKERKTPPEKPLSFPFEKLNAVAFFPPFLFFPAFFLFKSSRASSIL